MKLSDELLSRYIGGQMEIQNQREGYLYRGEIKEISITDEDIVVRFSWLAKGEGVISDRLPIPSGWIADDRLDYSASLMICSASDIGDDRLALNIWAVGELAVLYPPDGSKLDPSKVRGLVTN